MIRERQLNTIAYAAGTTQSVELPRDAVYHMIQLSISQGTLVSVQGGSGTGPTFDHNFPFSLIKNLRLLRNGADVVFQGSGAQLAKESFYLNRAHPFSRIYTYASNVETLLTATVRGVTVPSNSVGIGGSVAQFKTADAANSSATTYFDMMVELWLQIGVDDSWYSTLLDGRPLSSLSIEFTWAAVADFLIAGTANTSNTISASIQRSSLDQDNVDQDARFGTFKRSTLAFSNFQYNSSNNQVLLPRGNYFHGIIMQTLAQKANSTTVLQQENAVISQLQNRINSNYFLRNTTFKDLQRRNQNDRQQHPIYGDASGMPQGWAYMFYPSAGDRAAELVPTYVMDQFDLQISLSALASSENGVTTSSTLPTVNFLLEEVIPGVDQGSGAPRGAQAGSIARTSAKPYGG